MNINDPKRVQELYINKDTLSTRVTLHDKYSVNQHGWANWVFEQYKFRENINVLELGCGTGGTWIGREEQIPKGTKIILTDISDLMIQKTKEKHGTSTYFSFQVMDVQNITFEDGYFDIIIANHMLYHVLNISKALSEIKRVLKNDGCFYATTTGLNHLKELQEIYRVYEGKVKFNYSNEITFNLENGINILKEYFGEIEKHHYIDSLEVTEAQDLMDYIISYNEIPKIVYDEIYGIIEKEINKRGMFKIKKDSGMFICRLENTGNST